MWIGERQSGADADEMMLAPQLYFDRDDQETQPQEGT